EAPRRLAAVGELGRLAAPGLPAVGERRSRERPAPEAGRLALAALAAGPRGERERQRQERPHGPPSPRRAWPRTVTSIETSSSILITRKRGADRPSRRMSSSNVAAA